VARHLLADAPQSRLGDGRPHHDRPLDESPRADGDDLRKGRVSAQPSLLEPAIPAPPRAGSYACIYADPPWLERGAGQIRRGADHHYALMKTRDIAALPVPSLGGAECASLLLGDEQLPRRRPDRDEGVGLPLRHEDRLVQGRHQRRRACRTDGRRGPADGHRPVLSRRHGKLPVRRSRIAPVSVPRKRQARAGTHRIPRAALAHSVKPEKFSKRWSSA
jgi:hypothetical protein